MRELQSRQKIKRTLYSIPVLLVLLLVTLALARGAYTVMVKERQSAKDASQLADKVTTLTTQQAELDAEVKRLNTDAGVEEAIKAKYNVAGAGEHVAIIVDKPDTATTTPDTRTWYKRLWDDIVGR